MTWLRNLGPGFLVTAAFMGPGTVTTASQAGADFGFALAWALLFSVFATIVLQEMCARLGLVTGQGLGEAIRSSFQNSVLRWTVVGLVIGAIAFGNAAFQTGNILGAAGALVSVTGVSAAKYFFAAGLLAAGLTSAITAPLAAAYATAGVLGWERNLGSTRMRIVWAMIVIAGTILAMTATKPVTAIVFAQAANGILLPFVALFLLVVMNRRDLLGQHTNGIVSNFFGGGVVLVALSLGGFQLLKVWGLN